MGHIKDILTRCDNNTEIAEIAIEIEGNMANPTRRRAMAVIMAQFFYLINSSEGENKL